MNMRRTALGLMLIALAGGGGLACARIVRKSDTSSALPQLVLYGNVDFRQISLAFNDGERITDVFVEEGERVSKGQCVAAIDTRRLDRSIGQAQAQVSAQRQILDRLRSGSRPEEIAQARATLESARVEAANARQQYGHFKEAQKGAVTQRDIENSKAALDVAEARVIVAQKALDLAVAGPRHEEIAEADARLRGLEAQVGLLREQLADARLYAPCDAVVLSRALEPGEMAAPQRPVVILGVTGRKWIRAYVGEPNVGRVQLCAAASVVVDSHPERRFHGGVSFVSAVAEFTPRAVQTEELRTSLVYEVRIAVFDPHDELRLGMPATVSLDADGRT